MSGSKKTMIDYVAESGDMIRENVKNSTLLTAPLAEEYRLGQYKNIWLVASGSSSNGAACARMFMKKYLGCEIRIIPPFSFTHAEHDFQPEDMVIAISQSGYSTNTIEALKLLKSLGKKTIALTGDMNSDLQNYADLLIDYGVRGETVGYVTKGVTALALFLMLFSLEAAAAMRRITEQEKERIKMILLTAADCHESMQKQFYGFYKTHYKSFSSMTNAYICSCGANTGTAMEGALKIGETVQVPTAAYEIEEYIHGPNLQLTPNYTVFFIDGGCGSSRIKEIFDGTRLVTNNCFLLTNTVGCEGEAILNLSADLPEEVTPLCYLPFFQIFSHRVTEDLNRWEKHPLQKKMEKAVGAKTENYENSPLRVDDPSVKL